MRVGSDYQVKVPVFNPGKKIEMTINGRASV